LLDFGFDKIHSQCFISHFWLIAASYNQPVFSPCASWNATTITFSMTSTIGDIPCGIFVDTNNMVYVTDRANN